MRSQSQPIQLYPSLPHLHQFHHLRESEDYNKSGQALFTTLKLRSEGLVPSSRAQSAPANSTCGSSTVRHFPPRQGPLESLQGAFRLDKWRIMINFRPLNRNLSVRFSVLSRAVFLRSDTCFAVEKAGEERGALKAKRVGNLVNRQIGVAQQNLCP